MKHRRPLKPAAPVRKHHSQPDPGEVLCTCPICGSKLAERKCKLYCPTPGCTYFLSCADYY